MNQLFTRRLRRRRFALRRHSRHLSQTARSSSGFTLIETLVVVVIAGILASILAPGWLGFQTVANLNAAQDAVLQAMRQAQIQAVNQRQTWHVGFRETGSQVEWAHFAPGASPVWQPLHPNVRIARDSTTLSQNATGSYFVEFNDKGNVTPPFGRLNLASSRGDQNRRCVVVSTLLGLLRKAADGDCAGTQTE